MKKKKLQSELIYNFMYNLIISLSLIILLMTLLMVRFIKIEENTKNNIILDYFSVHINSIVNEPVMIIESLIDYYQNHELLNATDNHNFLDGLIEHNELISDVYILNDSGKVVTTSPYQKDIINNDFSSHPFYFEAINSDSIYWSKIYFSQNNDNPFVSVSKKSDGYVFVCILDLAKVTDTISAIDIGADNYVAITDVTGRYISHTNKDFVKNRLFDPYYDILTKTETQNIKSVEYLGKKMYPSIRYISDTNWTIIVYQSQSEMVRMIARLIISGVGITIILCIFVLASNKRKFKKLYAVFEKLINSTKVISEGKYDYLIEPSEYYELNLIIKNFNEMTKSIQNREDVIKNTKEQILQIHKNLEDQVLDRTKKLEHTNLELEQSLVDLRKIQSMLIQSEKMATLGELVAGISHEIRTPLGALVTISSFMEVEIKNLESRFKDGTLSKSNLLKSIEKLKESIKLAVLNIEQTTNFVDSLKKTSISQINMAKSEFNVCEAIQDAITTMKMELKKANIILNLHCSEDIYIYNYKGGISQIIINLVNNSIKHAFYDSKTGHIDIYVSQNSGIDITIKDDGHGIKDEFLPKIFDSFFTTAYDRGGTGLGLNVVKSIITELYGGNIECISKVNVGTTFLIHIPK